MAQITTLTDRKSNKTAYPITVDEAVFDSQGRSLKDRLAQIPTTYAAKTDIPTKVSQLTNDSKYITEAGLEAAKDELNGKIDELEIRAAYDDNSYYVGEWLYDELNPDAKELKGNKDVVTDTHIFLIDTTSETEDGRTKPVGELKRNNLLRFVDGSFAPTVGITEEQRASCDVALYLDAAASELYCSAGAFDATTFYNEHGVNTKLYNADGNEVRILRPWETTETKYSIGIAFGRTVYLLDQVTGKSGKHWKGIFTKPVMWDGIDVSLWGLPPTAMGLCPFTLRDGKARCFFYDYEGETNCKSGKGVSNHCSAFDNGKTYPAAQSVNQLTNDTYARANNTDNTKPYPCSEGGYHTRNVMITALELMMGTKSLHVATRFGSGISSCDACNNETQFLTNGGVRYKLQGTETWEYHAWSHTPANFFYDTEGKKTHLSNWINSEWPKEQCMESQMAYSFAMETGVAENTEFEFYGGSYRYVNITGAPEDMMNARVYKTMVTTLSAYDAEGATISYDVELNLRMSLFGGMTLCGDVFVYQGGGYEQVVTLIQDNPTTHPQRMDVYIEPNQRNFIHDSIVTKNDGGKWGFESEYRHLGTYTILGNNWMRHRLSYGSLKLQAGGSFTTGECAYGYDHQYIVSVIGARGRCGSRFGFNAYYGFCAPRSVFTFYAVSLASRLAGGSAQWLLALPQATAS